MPKKPEIPHEEIVRFIMAGNTTQDAKQHYGFVSDNVANLRVYAAFKHLGIKRPRYARARFCVFCGKEFVARDRKQRTCAAEECQRALIIQWHKNNPKKAKCALQKYRRSEKGHQSNLRMHRKRRTLGLYGSITDRWNFAAMEAKKSLRKLKELHVRNPWESRCLLIQGTSKLNRKFSPRKRRNVIGHLPLESVTPPQLWQQALRSMQKTIYQHFDRCLASDWERAVNKISGAIRTVLTKARKTVSS